MSTEDELIHLQSWLTHQDDSLEKLNAVVTRQQQDIDALTRELRQIRSLLHSLTSQTGGGPEKPPPHY